MHDWEGLTAPQFLFKPTPFVHLFIAFGTYSWHLLFHVLPERKLPLRYSLPIKLKIKSKEKTVNYITEINYTFTLFKKKLVLAPLFVQKFSSKIFETPAFITFVAPPHLHLTKLLLKYNTLSRTCYRAKNFSRLQISWTVWVT